MERQMKNNVRSYAITGLYRTYCSRGGTREHEGKLSEAIIEYTKAIRTDPTNPEAYCLRADTNKNRDFPRAIADYTKAIEIDHGFLVAYFHRGMAHFYNKDYDNAILDYEKAKKIQPKISEEIDPYLADAFIKRGDARKGKKEFQKAIKDYERFIKLVPKHKDVTVIQQAIINLKAKMRICD